MKQCDVNGEKTHVEKKVNNVCAQSQCTPGINIRVVPRDSHSLYVKDHFGKFWLFSLHPVTESSRAHTHRFRIGSHWVDSTCNLITAATIYCRWMLNTKYLCCFRGPVVIVETRRENWKWCECVFVCVTNSERTNERWYIHAKPIDDDFRSAITWIECSSRTFYGIVVPTILYIPI